MITNYVSIKTVLYQLALTIDERYWNETAALEWATHAYRQMNIEAALQDKVAVVEVINHKGELPSDLKFLTQIAYSDSTTCDGCDYDLDLPEGSGLQDKLNDLTSRFSWRPMRLTTNSFAKSICTNLSLFNCAACQHEFAVSPNLVMTTSLKSGHVLVAYLGYPLDDDGDTLIPDNEDLKEALLHYVLYKYWLSKYQMKEEGAEGRMEFHLKMWANMYKKALSLNLPDLSTMENIKNSHNRLVPRTNRFEQLFMTLSHRENGNF
jgi:hypothetical protein